MLQQDTHKILALSTDNKMHYVTISLQIYDK